MTTTDLYSPCFNPNRLSPALWLDASDQSTLVTDGAAYFDSGTKTLTKSHTTELAGGSNDDWFINCWARINVSSVPGYPISLLFSKGTLTGTTVEIGLTYLNDTRRFKLYVSNGSAYAQPQSPVMNNDTWYMVTAWHNAAYKAVYICVNSGSVYSSAYSGTLLTDTSQILIQPSSAASVTSYLDSMVFCRVSSGGMGDGTSGSLAKSLMDYLYNGGAGRRSTEFKNSSFYANGNPSGAVSWWDLDERSDTRYDRIGTNDLTDNNSVGYASGIASGNVQYDGDPITSWQDKSGNGRHFTANSDAARPTYKVAIQNGKSGIRLDGIDDLMAAGSTIANLRTIAMVVRYNNATVIKDYGGYWTPTSAAATEVIVAGSAGSTYFYPVSPNDMVYYKNGTITNETSANAGPMNAYTVCIFSGPTAWATYTYQIGMDRNQGSSRMIYADYCELVVLTYELNANQRNQLTRYLGSKWGISVA